MVLSLTAMLAVALMSTDAAAQSLSDLQVTGIKASSTAVGSTYNVTFTVTVKNFGAATSGSFVVAMNGWGATNNISTCTGTWKATNTSAGLAPGASRTLTVYGPGWVGPRVSAGTLSVKAYVDAYRAVKESSESNNARTSSIAVP